MPQELYGEWRRYGPDTIHGYIYGSSLSESSNCRIGQEEDYQETLSLMREVRYDAAFLFKYSERPGTYAAKHLPDTVSEEEKVRRLRGMIDLQNQLSEESNQRDIGKEFEVLIEGFSKRSREQLFGRTSQNKVVIFDKKNYKVGQFVKVRINRASSATLFGETIDW